MLERASHGLTISDAKDEILDLVTADYYKGPKKDFDPDQPGIFGSLRKQ